MSWYPSRRVGALRGGAFLVAAAMLVAGCGTGEKSSAPKAEGASSVASVAEATTPNAPSIPDTLSIPISPPPNFSLLRAPATLYTNCGDQAVVRSPDFQRAEFYPGQVFDPLTGRNIDRTNPTFAAGTELASGDCLVAGDEQNLRLIYIVTLRTPSSGLNPESTETQIISYDISNPTTPVAKELWPAEMNRDDYSHLKATKYGFMAYGPNGILGFDLNTLKLAWRESGDVEHHGGVSSEGYYLASLPSFAGGRTYSYHSAKDGAEVGSRLMPEGGISYTFPYGFFLGSLNGDGQGDFFDMRTAQFRGPVPFPVPVHGQFWGNKYLAYNTESGNPGGRFLRVWNLDTMELLLNREGDDVAGLNIAAAYIAGDYLYIRNNADSPVIDLTTSQKVSSGWKTRPVEIINKDWLLVAIDGADYDPACIEGLLGNCLMMSRTTKLAHAPNGKYQGPWY